MHMTFCVACSSCLISLLLTSIGLMSCLAAEVAEFYSEQLSRQGISNMIEPDTTVL